LGERPDEEKDDMSTETKVLTADRVNSVFMDCLFKADEDDTNQIVAEGIIHNVGLHAGRIEEHREEIHDMLAELPDAFRASNGPGESFPLLCYDRHGNLWTGFHIIMEQLVQLGIAIGEVEYTLPREDWKDFPGGMPHLTVQ
jgi:hypothetical protein